MPIYLYECDSCGVRFERMQRMSAQPLTDCPECEGHVHRVIQPVGVIFKGSGFYITDNRKGSSSTLNPAKDKENAEKEGADAKSESASDSSSGSSTEKPAGSKKETTSSTGKED
jgi:putative FmdB family regulatory protein